MTSFLNELVGPRQLIFAFVMVGLLTWLCYAFSKHITKNRIHGSAVAIIIGLALAYYGGVTTGGKKGIADLKHANDGGTLFGSLAQGYGAPPAVANAYKDVVSKFVHGQIKTSDEAVTELVKAIDDAK